MALVSAQLMIVSCSGVQESEFQHLGAVIIDPAVTQQRQERSLLNTFPFTEAELVSPPREVRQRDEVSVDFNSVASSGEYL